MVFFNFFVSNFWCIGKNNFKFYWKQHVVNSVYIYVAIGQKLSYRIIIFFLTLNMKSFLCIKSFTCPADDPKVEKWKCIFLESLCRFVLLKSYLMHIFGLQLKSSSLHLLMTHCILDKCWQQVLSSNSNWTGYIMQQA